MKSLVFSSLKALWRYGWARRNRMVDFEHPAKARIDLHGLNIDPVQQRLCIDSCLSIFRVEPKTIGQRFVKVL
ncbi:hypothetical protein SAMN05216227_10481 [Pseudorhodobacter antarcticus]|uniref:Uncharacterized protein n=1 Tax=Pseudorhodobacter antarcticus TaxID=1077947 RepID=A0A1H8M1G2_9RHOB|nr:hypothetical protein SAMN05216227_10481 [Pseudorhodobacter antarcticus]